MIVIKKYILGVIDNVSMYLFYEIIVIYIMCIEF